MWSQLASRGLGVGSLLVVSVAIAVAQGAVGLYVSLWLDVPPGPAVAVVGSAVYMLVALGTAAARRGTSAPIVAEAT